MNMAYRPVVSPNRPVAGISQDTVTDNRRTIQRIERRGFLRGSLSLGALTLLSGCDVSNDRSVQSTLLAMSRWNDRVQAFLFNPKRMAPTYTDAQVRKPPRFNAFYSIDDVKPVDITTWKLELAGLIADKRPWTLDAINALPQATQITRHICVEGWDYIGKWSGVSLGTFLQRIGADTTAKFVGFKCYDGYSGSIDMPTALHPQTQLTTRYADEVLPDAYGFPLRLRVATKLGFKMPKWITALEVTNLNPGGYWEDRGYNWFSGI
jgi:DMSO/TMAO reductase YedYZ molybdopterin-dependent catalytic subunit